MSLLDETNAAVEAVRQAFDGESQRPRPEWVRGKCPKCGDDIVSNCYYVSPHYHIVWECWSSLGQLPICNYRRDITTGKDNMEKKS